ncbi:MAG TPA: c-type cytochrome biogenesis protein CcmI [Aestuariivirgaceae bacterium]
MLLWVLFSIITAAVLLAILRPLARAGGEGELDERLFDREVYRDQLFELERDRQRGTIATSEAEAARHEIARRLLKTDGTAHAPYRAEGALRRLALVASIVALPVFAVSFYLLRGSPHLEGVPYALRLANAEANRDFHALIVKVENQLAAHPTDAEGWRVLAPAYRSLGRYDDAARAYAGALTHGKPDATLLSDRGEVLVMAAQGLVTGEAAQSFQDALKLDARNPKARYFAGLALLQEGKPEEALRLWQALLRDAPPDAPWRALVESQIAGAGGQQQGRMIASMVDGLAQRLDRDGNDLDGWLKLARARMVMGETDKARAALDRASALFKSDSNAMVRIEELRRELN